MKVSKTVIVGLMALSMAGAAVAEQKGMAGMSGQEGMAGQKGMSGMSGQEGMAGQKGMSGMSGDKK